MSDRALNRMLFYDHPSCVAHSTRHVTKKKPANEILKCRSLLVYVKPTSLKWT